MNDCDWTELPCGISYSPDNSEKSFSAYSTDSRNHNHVGLEIEPTKEPCRKTELENADNEALGGQVEDEKDISNKSVVKSDREKESCPICLSSFEDRSFLDQCFHIL